MLRKTLFWTHLGAGLLAALPLAVMAFTGILLAFEPQVLRLVEAPARTVSAPSGARRIPLDSLVLQATGLQASKVSAATVSSAPDRAVELRIGRERTVWGDPWSGNVTGRTGAVHAFFQAIEELHRWLGNRPVGGAITGVSVLLCLLLSVTGLFLWWPRNLKALRHVLWPRRGLAGRARDWQWHNAIGVLVLPLLVVLSLTGTVMSWKWAEAALYAAVGSEAPRRGGPPAGAPRTAGQGAEAGPRAWQAWLDTAVVHAPSGWERIVVQAPEGSKGPSVTVQLPGQGKRQASTVLLAPDGSFREFKPGRTDGGTRWRDLVRPLHTGELFGLPGQILMALASLGVLVLAWTGVALSWRRYGRWRLRRAG